MITLRERPGEETKVFPGWVQPAVNLMIFDRDWLLMTRAAGQDRRGTKPDNLISSHPDTSPTSNRSRLTSTNSYGRRQAGVTALPSAVQTRSVHQPDTNSVVRWRGGRAARTHHCPHWELRRQPGRPDHRPDTRHMATNLPARP